jgi:multisubunit Na+/H+ antiporter MnhB subunit
MIELFDIGLALLILGLAVWTDAARDTFSAIVGFVAYGLLLALAWVRLGGIDVALTEAALGTGLTGAMLINAATRLRETERQALKETPGAVTRVLAALLATCVTVGLAIAVLALPNPAPTLAPETSESMAPIGVGNPITAVLLAFRSMDTLLEAIVALLVLIGIWSLAPDSLWGGRPGPRHRVDPDGILAYLARILPPIGIIVGTYIFWIGADLPGGKFQGATLVAAMWLLVVMAGLADMPPTSKTWLRVALVAGPMIFIGVGAVGVMVAGAFLGLPDGLAKWFIKLIEWALFPSLALTLGLIVAGVPQRGDE